MSEDTLVAPEAEPTAVEAAADDTAAPKPARRKAPARSPRKKIADLPAGDATAESTEGEAAEPLAKAVKPKPKRAPRKAKVVETAPLDVVTADLFAVSGLAPEPQADTRALDGEGAPLLDEPVPATPGENLPGDMQASLPEMPPLVEEDPAALADLTVVADQGVLAAEDAAEPEGGLLPDEGEEEAGSVPDPGTADGEAPTGPRRKRKRRRGRAERSRMEPGEQMDMPGLGEPALSQGEPAAEPPVAEDSEASVAELDLPQAAESVEASVVPEALPLTVVSLGLEQPPVLSAAALAALGAARLILGTADALDRLQDLALTAPQRLCAADSVHLEVRHAGHAGCVVVVVGDAAGDGPAPELLADLGPGYVRVLPGVGRVQMACAALGLSAESVSVVDLRRAPLAALRGQLRAHRLLAVPVGAAETPRAVARLLVDSGFREARVWVCEFPSAGFQAKAWLAQELLELRDPIEARAVLVIATGPSLGTYGELPGLTDAALGDAAPAALPLAARLLALAWLQPAAWETGWAVSEGEASLALEWARAVPTARVRAVGIEPSILGVSVVSAGVGENLAAIPAASPLRCREWPMPDAVFIRGAVGLSEWLAAAWARLAPGGRLVATAEDDQARADLLAFAAEVPAEAWEEVSLARGESVAGRLRFVPGAPVRLALWRKPALS